MTQSDGQRTRHPDLWLRESRGGYGYTQHVPCRVLTDAGKRIKIEALRADGSTVIRYVRRDRLRRG